MPVPRARRMKGRERRLWMRLYKKEGHGAAPRGDQARRGTQPQGEKKKKKKKQQAGSGRSCWWAGLAWGTDSVGLGVGGGMGRSTG